jgi:DNA-binding transcriptional ArsR family regulator
MKKDEKLPIEALNFIAQKFHSLSDPVRLQIIQELKEGEKSGKELIEIIQTSQSTISKQLKNLFKTEIVDRRQDGNTIYYYIKDETIHDICKIVCSKIKRDLDDLNKSFK